MSNINKLQLLSCENLFKDREAAMTYVKENFTPNSLLGEPAVVSYGDYYEPNAILVLGLGNGKTYAIDTAELKEQMQNADAENDTIKDSIESLLTTIGEIINKVGLTEDTNKIKDRISYEPDRKDKIIGDAETIAEAVAKLSKYAQELSEDTEFSVADTNSVKLVFKADDNADEKVLKAKVKISNNGDDDEQDFNNNILGIKKDGLYAAVHLEYDEIRNELKFYTSGMKNGKFQNDARKEVISLGKHSEVVADNSDENPIKVIIKKDGNVSKVSSKLALSEKDNILKITDGKLTANVSLRYKESSNELVFNNGLEKKVIPLNTGSILESTSYDSASESIILRFRLSNGQISEQTILVRGILNEWGVDNTNKTVTLTKNLNEGIGPDVLSADVNVSEKSDNILVKDGGSLYVGGVSSNIRYKETTVAKTLDALEKASDKVADDLLQEIENRTHAIEDVLEKLEDEAKRRYTDDEYIKHLISDLDVEGLKKTVEEFQALYSEFEKEWIEKKTEINKAIADAEAVAERVTTIEENLGKVTTDLVVTNTNLANLTNDVTAVKDQVKTIQDGLTEEIIRTNGLSNKVADLETKVDNHIANYATLNGKVSDLTTAISNEVIRAKGVETAINDNLQTEITTARNNEASLGATISKVQSDLEIVSTSAFNLRTDLTNEKTRAEGEEKRIEGLVKTAQSRVDANTTSITSLTAEVHSNTDAINNEVTARTKDVERLDQKIDNVSEKVSSLESNITLTTDATLETAKAYTDAETTRAKGAEEKLQSSIDGLTAKDDELKTEIDGKVGSVELIKSGEQKYTFRVDGREIGDIDIPKDQFLKDARYDAASHKLILTVVLNDEGQKDLEISLAELVDTYKPGDGLKLTEDGTFSVKISEGDEGYLSVSEGGIKVTGINEALEQKADKAELGKYYTKEETDGKYLTEHQSLANYATKTEVESVDGKVESLKTTVEANSVALGIINSGNPVQEGSLAYILAEATSLVNAEAQTRKEKDDELETAIGNKANVSDVYDKTYIDGKDFASKSDLINLATSEMVSAVDRKVDANTAALDTKANKTEVYSKTEANAEFLSQKDAEYTYATQSKVSDVEGKADANTKSIEDLAKVVEGEKFTVETSDTVELLMSDGKVLKSNLRISNESGNALKANGTGAYVNVSLDYNAADNTLIFSDGNGTTNLKLSGGSVIKSAQYDDNEKKLIFKFEVGEDIVISVSDLFNHLEAVNPTNDPIQLDIVRGVGSQGGDTIQATLRISTVDGNLIEKENGTLFASNKAEKHTAVIHGETITVQKALSDAINGVESLDTRTTALEGRVTTIEGEIVDLKAKDIAHDESLTDLKTRMTTAEANIITCQENITKLQGDVATTKATVEEHEGRIGKTESDVESIKTDIEGIKKTLGEYNSRLETVENDVTNIKGALTSLQETVTKIQDKVGSDENEKTLIERISVLEKICETLIDFGSYSN